VQLVQATSQLHQRTGTDDVRHRLWLSTGTEVRVDLLPPLPAGTPNDPVQCGSDSGETILSLREVKTCIYIDIIQFQ